MHQIIEKIGIIEKICDKYDIPGDIYKIIKNHIEMYYGICYLSNYKIISNCHKCKNKLFDYDDWLTWKIMDNTHFTCIESFPNRYDKYICVDCKSQYLMCEICKSKDFRVFCKLLGHSGRYYEMITDYHIIPVKKYCKRNNKCAEDEKEENIKNITRKYSDETINSDYYIAYYVGDMEQHYFCPFEGDKLWFPCGFLDNPCYYSYWKCMCCEKIYFI